MRTTHAILQSQVFVSKIAGFFSIIKLQLLPIWFPLVTRTFTCVCLSVGHQGFPFEKAEDNGADNSSGPTTCKQLSGDKYLSILAGNPVREINPADTNGWRSGEQSIESQSR